MFVILILFIIIGAFRAIHCEWIEISQPIRNQNTMANNPSTVLKTSNFDYSTYRDFFSIIEPEIEFPKEHEESMAKNISSGFAIKKRISQKNARIFFDGSRNVRDNIGKNHLIVNSTNEDDSKHQMDLGAKHSSSSSSRLQPQPIRNEHEKRSNVQANQKNRMTLTRIEQRPFDFNGVLKFFADMQQSISLTAFSGVRDKIKFLENFKNTLLQNIGE